MWSALLARRRRTARLSRRTALKVEQLDPRIALAVDQFWVQPDLPPPVNMPSGSFADRLKGAFATRPHGGYTSPETTTNLKEEIVPYVTLHDASPDSHWSRLPPFV